MRERIEKVSDEGLNNEKEVFDLPIEKRVVFPLFVSKTNV